MPGYKTHVGGGVVAYVGALALVASCFVLRPTLRTSLEWFFFSVFGSLFPDVDTKSKGQILFYQAVTLWLLFLLWAWQLAAFIWVALIAMIPVLVNHRGLFHRVWFVVFISFASAFFFAQWYPSYRSMLMFDAFFFSVGAISHILFDSWGTRIKNFKTRMW